MLRSYGDSPAVMTGGERLRVETLMYKKGLVIKPNTCFTNTKYVIMLTSYGDSPAAMTGGERLRAETLSTRK